MRIIYTKEQIIKILRDIYFENGKVTRRDVPFITQIKNKFGSFNNALTEAGIDTNRNFEVTKEMAIQSLINFKQHYGVSPRANDTNCCEILYDRRTYFKLFNVNSWADVLEQVNLDQYFKLNTMSKAEIKQEYIRISEENNFENGATMKFITQNNFIIGNAIRVMFGGINGLRREIGYIENKTGKKKYNKKDIERKLLRLYLENNSKIPTLKQIEDCKYLPTRSGISATMLDGSIKSIYKTIIDKYDR